MAKSKDSKSVALSPGGLARDADGRLAKLPSDLAHSINYDLLHALTLLVAAMREHNHKNYSQLFERPDDLTNSDSRIGSLLIMAEEKLNGVIRSMSPYV